MKNTEEVMLSSTSSMKVSLDAIRKGEAGLSEKRKKLLERVPNSNDWAALDRDSVTIKDIAYLSASTHHEFALLRGKGGRIMLTVEEARKIGIRACINKIGYEFCKLHADNATSAYGEEDGYVNCFVGVSDSPAPECDITKVSELILTSGKKWPCAASCNVYLEIGEIEFLEHRVP